MIMMTACAAAYWATCVLTTFETDCICGDKILGLNFINIYNSSCFGHNDSMFFHSSQNSFANF